MSKPCVVCGEIIPIKPRSPKNKITCSKECSKENRREAQRVWWAKNEHKYEQRLTDNRFKSYLLSEEYKFEACPWESGQVQQEPFGGMM